MVRRGFSACSQTELAFLRGKQTSKDCIETIFSILIPFAKIHHENDFDFHQDTAQKTMAVFFLSVMEWAVCSADLNPISYK